MHRVIDYCGTSTVSHQQEIAAFPYILDHKSAEEYARSYESLERDVGVGMALQIGQGVEVEFFSVDVGKRRAVGEEWLRSVMEG